MPFIFPTLLALSPLGSGWLFSTEPEPAMNFRQQKRASGASDPNMSEIQPIEKIRNIAMIAHVDHGKTTLVDRLLQQSGTLGGHSDGSDRMMDTNDLEQERGITILSKTTAIQWGEFRINIVDTPGHADFGGEVERILSMVDAVLLLVDAVDGPMPQTRFVTRKAFEQGLNPLVVVNKVDRPGARPYWAIDQVFELFDQLGGTDEQLDFPVIYASALEGKGGWEPEELASDLSPLFEAVHDEVAPPDVDLKGPPKMQISSLDYSHYVGVIGIGRITRGRLKRGMSVTVVGREGGRRSAKVLQVMTHKGLNRVEVDEATAGDIVAITGIDGLDISDTITDPSLPEAMPRLTVDEPTVSMTFQVNTSPRAGQDGRYVTSRHIKERLEKELVHNVALRVDETDNADKFKVSGRGELHLSVLIENMRREGYELGISRPEVIIKEIDGERHEPYEQLTIDIDGEHQGSVMEAVGERRAEMQDMVPDGQGRVRLDFIVPARGLIGFRTQFLSLTSGTGIMTHSFSHYDRVIPEALAQRTNGVMISMAAGQTSAYALFNLQDRGRLMVDPGTTVYNGMIIGIHSRPDDLSVNPIKAKQLTNVRAAGSDETIQLTPSLRLSLEDALEFIDDDELVEATPNHIRLRKKLLTESQRKRAAKGG